MGLKLDINTLVYIFIFGNLFILLLITNYRSGANKDMASTMFVWAKTAQLFFWSLFLFWINYMPIDIYITLNNLMVIIGSCFEITALLLMMSVPISRIKLYYIRIIISGMITLFLVVLFYKSPGLRMAFISLWSIVFVIFPSYHLTANKKGTPLQKTLGLLFFVYALIMLVRAVIILIWSKDHMDLIDHISQWLFYFGMYLLMVLGAAGFILLSNEHTYVKLKRIASYDNLTGIRNRGAFFEEAQLMFEHAVSEQTYISFLEMDLDHFKKVNDTYGHDMGDTVLEHFASTIKDFLKNGELFGRLGGEEFAVMLYGLNEESCDRKAEALREAVMQTSTQKIPEGYTVSIGVITIIPDSEFTLHKLYRLSDKALYQAKHGGRNRVIRYRKTH